VSFFEGYARDVYQAWQTVSLSSLDKAASVLESAYLSRSAVVYSCGNGGSASIANHLVCDHTKGLQSSTSLLPRVFSLNSNVELVTAIANDMDYSDVFAYQLLSSSPGDVLIAISSSGASPSITRALEWANEHGLHTIALTGFDGGRAREIAKTSVHVDSKNYGIVEDVHQSIMHALAQSIVAIRGRVL
jgi:D-sedoheptulose 7-phosphate isomerase